MINLVTIMVVVLKLCALVAYPWLSIVGLWMLAHVAVWILAEVFS